MYAFLASVLDSEGIPFTPSASASKPTAQRAVLHQQRKAFGQLIMTFFKFITYYSSGIASRRRKRKSIAPHWKPMVIGHIRGFDLEIPHRNEEIYQLR